MWFAWPTAHLKNSIDSERVKWRSPNHNIQRPMPWPGWPTTPSLISKPSSSCRGPTATSKRPPKAATEITQSWALCTSRCFGRLNRLTVRPLRGELGRPCLRSFFTASNLARRLRNVLRFWGESTREVEKLVRLSSRNFFRRAACCAARISPQSPVTLPNHHALLCLPPASTPSFARSVCVSWQQEKQRRSPWSVHAHAADDIECNVKSGSPWNEDLQTREVEVAGLLRQLLFR